MSPFQRSSLVLMILAGFTTSVTAQASAPSRLPVSAVSPAFAPSPVSPRVPLRDRGSHWKEGGAIAAAFLGVLGFAAGMGWCAQGDADGNANCLGTGLGLGIMGAGVGFTVGALVGALVPRSEASAP